MEKAKTSLHVPLRLAKKGKQIRFYRYIFENGKSKPAKLFAPLGNPLRLAKRKKRVCICPCAWRNSKNEPVFAAALLGKGKSNSFSPLRFWERKKRIYIRRCAFGNGKNKSAKPSALNGKPLRFWEKQKQVYIRRCALRKSENKFTFALALCAKAKTGLHLPLRLTEKIPRGFFSDFESVLSRKFAERPDKDWVFNIKTTDLTTKYHISPPRTQKSHRVLTIAKD